MAGFNQVILVGNLTRNPELRYTPNGTAVASFGLASSRRFKQGDDLKEEVCFVDIVAFGKQAENAAQYISKGSQVLVDGRLQQRRWEKEDGQKRSKLAWPQRNGREARHECLSLLGQVPVRHDVQTAARRFATSRLGLTGDSARSPSDRAQHPRSRGGGRARCVPCGMGAASDWCRCGRRGSAAV